MKNCQYFVRLDAVELWIPNRRALRHGKHHGRFVSQRKKLTGHVRQTGEIVTSSASSFDRQKEGLVRSPHLFAFIISTGNSAIFLRNLVSRYSITGHNTKRCTR